MKEKIKMYYENYIKGVSPMWSIERVWNTARKEVITKEEYKEITGFEFPSKEAD